jgi:hypothetical protein
VISKTEVILGVEIPSQLGQQVEFNYDILKDTPEGNATEMVSVFGLPKFFIKLITKQIQDATEEIVKDYIEGERAQAA